MKPDSSEKRDPSEENREHKRQEEKSKIAQWFSFLPGKGIEKYLCLLLVGACLLIISLPAESKKEQTDAVSLSETTAETVEAGKTITVSQDTYEALLETRLEEILNLVEGVGRTEVMITLKSKGEKVVLMEEPFTKNIIAETDSEGGSRNTTQISQSETTVYIEGSDGVRTPYVVKELEPAVEGVVVIAEGGNNVETVAAIVDAVTALFDVPSHKVKVMKMK